MDSMVPARLLELVLSFCPDWRTLTRVQRPASAWDSIPYIRREETRQGACREEVRHNIAMERVRVVVVCGSGLALFLACGVGFTLLRSAAPPIHAERVPRADRHALVG